MAIGNEESSDQQFCSLSDPPPGSPGAGHPWFGQADPSLSIYVNQSFPAPSVLDNRRDPVPDTEINSYIWFHDDLNREDSQAKLMSRHQDGMYCVRNSSHPGFTYCLSVYFRARVYHIPIRMEDGVFLLGEKRQHEPHFISVPDLISHYQQSPLFLKRDKSIQTNLLLALPK